MTDLTLANVPIGGRARIVTVGGDPTLQQRLLELGLLPGVEVAVVRAAPLGDPLEIRLLGYNLSVRRSEAAHVNVEVLP